MPLFSQRRGLTPIRNNLQIESIDDTLKNRLWNAIKIHYINFMRDCLIKNLNVSEILEFFNEFWDRFLGLPIDTRPNEINRIFDDIRQVYFF